jgi:multidrug resistance efflux pump
MTMPSRGVRLFAILGFIVLLGSAVGARWVLDQPASGTTSAAQADSSVMGIVALGFADVENGIVFLQPTQSGTVESVMVKEGDDVSAGDLLLTLDNRVQKANLDMAEADLAAAKSKLKDAETQLPKKWQAEIDKAQYQVESVGKELAAAEIKHKIEMKVLEDPDRKINKDQRDFVELKLESAQKAFKAQEAALEVLKASNPQGIIDRARDDVKAKQAQRDRAHVAYVECDLYAPVDGSVLRVFAQQGELLSTLPRQGGQAAVQLCPNTPRIIRAEVLQEWAGKIQKGQIAFIEDDSRNGVQWKGKVERVSDWFAPRRMILQEPFQFNDIRTLECIVSLDPGSPPIRINQRVRVTIKQGGP